MLWLGVRVKIDPGYRCNVTSYLQLYHHAFPTTMAAPLNWGTWPSWNFFSQVFEHQNEKTDTPAIRHFPLLEKEAVLCIFTEPLHAMTTQHQAPFPGPCVNGKAAVSGLYHPFHLLVILSAQVLLCLAGVCLFCAYFISQCLWSTFQRSVTGSYFSRTLHAGHHHR